MEIIQKRPGISIVVAFIVGLFIGLVVLGWNLWPVEYTGASLQDLVEADQAVYLRVIADAYSQNPEKVKTALGGWREADVAVCQLAATSTDPDEKPRLEAVAFALNGQGCAGVAAAAPAETPAEESGGLLSKLGPVFGLVLLLVVLIVAIIFVINRRNAMMAGEGAMGQSYADMPAAPPVTSDEESAAIPLARFQTTYTYGHDSYDDSFSIESANRDFLGECGVGISESIGTDTPKNVAAFEVWLFDKNDIRTVTKVVMSDHAFFDEALKAKLAPKGEPVLARENETIVLETASLIINAEVKEMQYGTGVLPPQSFFERMVIELSAWAKEGDYEPDVQGRVDEILNY